MQLPAGARKHTGYHNENTDVIVDLIKSISYAETIERHVQNNYKLTVAHLNIIGILKIDRAASSKQAMVIGLGTYWSIT